MINLEAWISYESRIAAGDPKTGFAISPAIGSDQRFEVIDLWVSADHANAGDCAVRIAFSATTTMPTAAALAIPGVLYSHSGMGAGMRCPGIPGIGAVGEELRVTCEDPASGDITINFLGRIVPTK